MGSQYLCHRVTFTKSKDKGLKNIEGCQRVNRREIVWGVGRGNGKHSVRNFTFGTEWTLQRSICVYVCLPVYKVTHSVPRRKSFLRERIIHTINDTVSG